VGTYRGPTLPGSRNIPLANGGIVTFAGGGFMESTSQIAQIAPAGAWRLWAEPETGGEAYIPLSPAKRQRSLEVWQETGRRLGAFADGGITGGRGGASGQHTYNIYSVDVAEAVHAAHRERRRMAAVWS